MQQVWTCAVANTQDIIYSLMNRKRYYRSTLLKIFIHGFPPKKYMGGMSKKYMDIYVQNINKKKLINLFEIKISLILSILKVCIVDSNTYFRILIRFNDCLINIS